MPPAGGAGASSPFIADGDDPMMHGGEFNDIPDDALDSTNLFFSNSPDTLQSLQSSRKPSGGQRLITTKIEPTDYPSSPTGSFREDSSDSASSSKKESPGSHVDQAMEENNDSTMDWADNSAFLTEDNVFQFGRDEAHPSSDAFFNWATPREAFADDADGLSQSKPMEVVSPSLTAGNSTPDSKVAASEVHSENHQRQNSQISATSINGMGSMSRELSPMSHMITSQGSSPSAISPKQRSRPPPDFWNLNHMNAIRAALPMQNGFMMNNPFNGSMPAGMSMGQEMAFQGQPFQPLPQPKYELSVLSTPPKSRVETQIPLQLLLHPMPPGITKLHLPPHTISKPKLLTKPPPRRSPEMLELSVALVCTSAMESPELKEKALQRALVNPQRYLPPENDDGENSPQNGADVRICGGCIVRERKRASRKKSKKPEEEKAWAEDEERRVIVFNAHEVKDFETPTGVMSMPNGAMMIKAPLRIACYCRHHGEKMGFNVIFTVRDWQDKFIAQAMSDPIMITDDHKTHPQATSLQSQSMMPIPNGHSLLATAQPTLAGPSTAASGYQSRAVSRPASPVQGGPATKKRKSSSGSRVPTGLAMTPLEVAQSLNGGPSSQVSAATSPYTNSLPYQVPEQQPMVHPQPNGQPPFQSPTTPNGTELNSLHGVNRSPSMDNLLSLNMYSAPNSGHPSRVPSPNMSNGLQAMQAQFQQQQQQIMGSHHMANLPEAQPTGTPLIRKIIPTTGPKVGGIEVTVLGAGFHPAMDIYFGQTKAISTHYWSAESVICVVPPAPQPGAVQVSFSPTDPSGMGQQGPNPPVIFTYNDDVQDSLMRMALTILGMKMNGAHHDLSDVARRVINESTQNPWSTPSTDPTSGLQSFNRRASHEELEQQLLSCLHAIDVEDSPHRAQLDLENQTGHTMLHLASVAGYRRLVSALLSRGADPNAQDRGHFTPLHLAVLYDQHDIVRRLRLDGANCKMRSLSGETALDLAKTNEMRRAISRPGYPRSQSTSSLHSRASSSASLRSLADLSTLQLTTSHAVDDGEESPEYTSGDFSDEDPDENNYLTMRRSSTFRTDADRAAALQPDMDPSPPNAPAVALKEQLQQQVQQLQQIMHLHLQNLPHLPQMPQMPQFPGMGLPDYQAYLQQAPFMRRMTSFMPSMTGSRPGSEDGQEGKVDHRWWDFSSYMNNSNSTPPPAYEELYPEGEEAKRETKQASAAQAAVEAEADMKCAQLYDTDETTEEAESSMATVVEAKVDVPSVLKIGRKHAITKEQQEQFLRAREEKLKRLSNDRKLFFIWIPLLIVVLFAMSWNYIPTSLPSISSIPKIPTRDELIEQFLQHFYPDAQRNTQTVIQVVR